MEKTRKEFTLYSFACPFGLWMPISRRSMQCESAIVSFFRSSSVCAALRVTLSLERRRHRDWGRGFKREISELGETSSNHLQTRNSNMTVIDSMAFVPKFDMNEFNSILTVVQYLLLVMLFFGAYRIFHIFSLLRFWPN